jgi:hypothetical protein
MKNKNKTKPYDGRSPITLRYRKSFVENFVLGEMKLPEPFNVMNVGNLPEYFIEILEMTFDYMKLKKNEAKVFYDEDDTYISFKIVPLMMEKN